MIKTMTSGITANISARATPFGSIRFDWIATLFSTWVIGGLYLDGWAHEHGRVDNTFFTPWHAVLYGGVFALFIFLGFHQVRNMSQGHAWQHALPAGYSLSLAGAFLFLLGGGLDFIWHTLFGIEVNLETLLSPTHLLLATSGVLMVSGPLRAAWQKRRSGEAGDLKMLWPMVISLTLVLSILTFFTQFVHPFHEIYAGRNLPGNLSAPSWMIQSLGIASILLQTALLMGVVLLAVRHGKLPFGALTVIIGVNNAMMTLFHDRYLLVPAALLGGIITDLLLSWLKPSETHQPRFALFAFAAPVIFYSLYYLMVELTQGIAWTIHFWLGSIFMAGIVGLFVSFLLVLPLRTVDEMAREQE